MSYPEIPFIKLKAEKILPFEGPAAMTLDKEVFPDGVLILTSELHVIFANQQALKILNSDEEDLIGNRLNIAGLNKNTNLIHATTIDNSQKIIELRTSPVCIDKKQYILVILQDITVHYENINRLNFAIEATELGLWDYEFINNSTSINSYYATMLDYKFEEFESGSWVTLVHPIDLENVWDNWNRHIANELPYYTSDYRIKTKKGVWKWIRARGMVKDRNAQGEPLHFIGTHQDITAQKQAERQLQLLYEINAISNEFLSLEEKLERSLEKILGILFADKGMIHIQNKLNQFELAISKGFEIPEIYMIENDPENYSAFIDIEKLSSEGMIININDKDHYSYLSKCKSSTALILPLKITNKEKVDGLLQIHWHQNQPITNLDVNIAKIACVQLSEAIERENLRKIARSSALDKERQRLARELHDSLSQSLYSVLLTADGGEDYAKQGDQKKTIDIFSTIKSTIQQSLKEMRLLIYELRPSILSNAGLIGALKHRLDTVEKRAGIKTKFVGELNQPLNDEIEIELYRIAQEALNNVIKHANAKTVAVSITQDNNKISMKIEDNGNGFYITDDPAFGGFGLASMKERASNIGGEVRIQTNPEQGTSIQVTLPLSSTENIK